MACSTGTRSFLLGTIPYSKDFGFSRDQLEPLVAAMGVWGKKDELRRLWDALPEDGLGKHSFNGRYRNALGQDGWDCSAVKRRGCDATRDCSLKTDTRDCSLKTDTRDCSLQEDTRSCGYDVCFIGCFHVNDPICELAKATQNAIYKANKDACEVAKAAQNVIYAGEKAACEAAKATQNAIYIAEKDACEVVKASEKLTCEANKTIDLNLCRSSNYHDGDFIGPMTENLFSRAMNETLAHSVGEAQLLGATGVRIKLASNRDDTGDDLNLIVLLLMSQLRSPTVGSGAAIAAYASFRPHSYGSYLAAYRSVYGIGPTDGGEKHQDLMRSRIGDGIRSGWRVDKPPVNGAVHWYHRAETRGNPLLAELYDPIIDRFIYGDVTGTLSTLDAVNPAPTIASLTPTTGLSKRWQCSYDSRHELLAGHHGIDRWSGGPRYNGYEPHDDYCQCTRTHEWARDRQRDGAVARRGHRRRGRRIHVRGRFSGAHPCATRAA